MGRARGTKKDRGTGEPAPGRGAWPPELQDLQRRGGMSPDWHEAWHGRGDSTLSEEGAWRDSEERSFVADRERQRDLAEGLRKEFKNERGELHRTDGPAVISLRARAVHFYENNEIVKDGRPAIISHEDGTAGYWVGRDPIMEDDAYGIYMYIDCDGSQEWWTVDGLQVASKTRENGFQMIVLVPEYQEFFNEIDQDNSPEALLRKKRIQEAVDEKKAIMDLDPAEISSDPRDPYVTFKVGQVKDESGDSEVDVEVTIAETGEQEWFAGDTCIRIVSADGSGDTYLNEKEFREVHFGDPHRMQWVREIMKKYEEGPWKEKVEAATRIQRGDRRKQQALREYEEFRNRDKRP